MRRLACALAVMCVALGCRAERKPVAKHYWWELETRQHPPKTDIALPLFARHPRLIFRPESDVGLGRSFDRVRTLYAGDATFKAIFDKALRVPTSQQDPAMLAASWIVTGRDEFAQAAVDRMVREKLNKSGEPYYSNVYIHALAYDWLFDHPALTAEKKSLIVNKMIERLKTELADLDDQGMAAWHGRNQAANGTMIAAMALGDLPGCEPLLRRAAGHYISSLRALQFSEGWPEGASYWIYNRAGPYPLAADCVMTALGSDRIADLPIRDIMRTVGLWQTYQYAPNGVFEPYGDSAGSLRLGQTGWWELSTDHYAKLSRDPGVAAGADYLRNRSPNPYGSRPYHWSVVYTYEPTVRPKDADYDPAKPEAWMRAHLPQSMLFGRGTLGVAFFRGDWGDPDETYATFKAGDLLAHHDHYDTGAFGIHRGGDLTPRTGVYAFYTGPHRLGYFVQSVATNTLLVLAPGEFSSYLKEKYPQSGFSVAGGQRVIRPTSFNCVDIAHFKKQLNAGPHLERGDITAFDSKPGVYDYVAADITAAYNSTRFAEPGNKPKVSKVTRQMVYLRPEQAFVVYDRIEMTDDRFLPKFLMHAQAKPITEREKLLVAPPASTTQGDAESGIYESPDRTVVTEAGRGRLTQVVLLPEKSRVLKIGGPQFCYYVETDGDQSNGFNGQNLVMGMGKRGEAISRTNQWRVEVEPTSPSRSTRFLNVLLPRLKTDRSPLPRVERVPGDAGVGAVRVGRMVIVFSHTGMLPERFAVDAHGKLDWLILDAEPNAPKVLSVAGGEDITARANAEGVIYQADIHLQGVSSLVSTRAKP
ncbi:MAG: hypothetical protein PHU85_12080 [Phycisphaerae bacterium]|nr:hypothetical protein [Phycisphaerae bacterium]